MSTVYTIGSFNMYKMNLGRNTDEDKNASPDSENNKKKGKDLETIARIIDEEGFDIVAMQEVLNRKIMKMLLEKLNYQSKYNWDFKWASPTPYTSSSNEGYAYVWRTDRVRLIESNSNPEIYNWYRIKGNRELGNGGLIRPPFVARFTPNGKIGGCFQEIRLINTHIIFSKTSNSETTLSDLAVRKEELRILSEEIYRRLSTRVYKNNIDDGFNINLGKKKDSTSMPAVTILLGDYNLCLVGSESKINEYIEMDQNRRLHIVQKDLTSLKQPPKEGEEELQQYYSHNYDHFAYGEDFDDKMTMTAQRVDALEKYMGNDLRGYRQGVSDHVPIKLKIDLIK